MKAGRPTLRVFLDEGVPVSVGKVFETHGHEVIYFDKAAFGGSPDQLVCLIAEENEAILIALDQDMKQIAQSHGISKSRFRRLSLIKLSCKQNLSANRVEQAMSLIEHEWAHSEKKAARRYFWKSTQT